MERSQVTESPTKAEDEVRGLVVNLITRAVMRNFPDAVAMPFGSFESKLYLPSGWVRFVWLPLRRQGFH